MAMPPGGQSSWFHHSDAYRLDDSDGGRTWALVDVTVATPRLTIGFSRAGESFNFFSWLRLEVHGDDVIWTHVTPKRGERLGVHWTPATPARDLFVPSILDPSNDAPVAAATLLAPGHVRVEDRDGRPRIELSLRASASTLLGPSVGLPREQPRVHVTMTGPLTQAQASRT